MDYLVVAVVAGLAAVERKGFLQAMLSRPVVLAPVVGLALGDPLGGLVLGPALELLWLGAVNMGASLPPNEALGTAAISAGAVLAGRTLGTGVTPAVAVLAVAAGGMLASLGRATDRAVEDWNVRLASRAEAYLDRGSPSAAVRENLVGLIPPFVISALIAPAAAALVAWAIPAVLRAFPDAPRSIDWGWAALLGLAAAAGARSFRSSRGLQLFLATAGLTVVLGRMLRGTP